MARYKSHRNSRRSSKRKAKQWFKTECTKPKRLAQLLAAANAPKPTFADAITGT